MMQQQPSGIAAALPPGQAPQGLPFNVPQSGSSAGISPVTPKLTGMSAQQLGQLLQQVMQSRDPMMQAQLLPIAGALNEAVKAEKMKQAAANQGVIEQNAQQQQQPQVVPELIAQAQQMQKPQGIEQALPQEPQQSYAKGGVSKNPYDTLYEELTGIQEDIPMGLTPEELAAQAAERMAVEEARARQQKRIDEPLTEGVKKSRADLVRLAEEDAATQTSRISDFGSQAKADYEAKLARANSWGPTKFGKLAGAVSNEKGKVLQSLGAGIGAISASQEADIERAEDKYREAQVTLRAMEDTKRQMARLEAQRMYALQKEDMVAARAAEDGILKAQADLATLQSAHTKATREAKTGGIKAVSDVLKAKESVLGKKDLGKWYEATAAAQQAKAGAGAGFKLSQAQARIISDAQKQAEKLVSPTGPLAVEYATADEAGKQAIREREKRRIAAEQWRAAGYDLEHLDAALRSEVTSPVSAAPATPGMPAGNWGKASVVTP